MLDAIFATLQPALAGARLDPSGTAPGLPPWTAPPDAGGEAIEILTLDGALLFASGMDCLPMDAASAVDAQLGFWLRQGSLDARTALDTASTGVPARFHATAATQTGALIHWDVTVEPLRTGHGAVDGLLVVSRINAARTRDEASLRRETWLRQREERLQHRERTAAADLQMLADAMPALITLLDRALVHRFANQASLDWFGLPPAAIIGRLMRELPGPDGTAWCGEHAEAALAGHKVRFRAAWPRHDGTARQAEIQYLPRISPAGGTDGFYVLAHDLATATAATALGEATDVNAVVTEMEATIMAALGPAIVVETALAASLWPVAADRTPLAHAVLQLCLNARDAMPGGGRIGIETANTVLDDGAAREAEMAPGPYVTLSISDTGAGMTPDVAARAFDPFFTTKPAGAAGLGLPMIYGFVRACGGQMRIYTELGRGTTMQLHLPPAQTTVQPL